MVFTPDEATVKLELVEVSDDTPTAGRVRSSSAVFTAPDSSNCSALKVLTGVASVMLPR